LIGLPGQDRYYLFPHALEQTVIMLPNLIGIGAQRSGTTWIYEMLKSHPEICMSPEKEINFFISYYERGLQWYSDFFNRCCHEKVIGEFSPRYLANDLVPKRISQIIPDANLLVSLRNPVDQIFSRYNYMVARQMYRQSFPEALKEKDFLISEAFYYKHLQRYFDYFPKEQILILIYEDTKLNPFDFLKSIYRFIDVDVAHIPENIHEKFHFTRNVRNRKFEAITVMFKKYLTKLRLYDFANFLKYSGIVGKIREINTKTMKHVDKMDFQLRTRLNEIFHEDKNMLSELIGRDLSFWN